MPEADLLNIDADRERLEQEAERAFDDVLSAPANTSATEQGTSAEQPAPKVERTPRKRPGRLDAVDRHPQRLEIEALLVRGAALRPLGKRFGLSHDALFRHLRRLKKTAPKTVTAIVAADWKVPPEKLEALRLETSAGWLAMLRRQFDVLVKAQDRNSVIFGAKRTFEDHSV